MSRWSVLINDFDYCDSHDHNDLVDIDSYDHNDIQRIRKLQEVVCRQREAVAEKVPVGWMQGLSRV